MVDRVKFGDLGGGEFGIKVSRDGVDVDSDDAPNLYSALDSQQIVLAGRVLASDVPNTFGVSYFHSFGITLGYVPVVLFELVYTTESDDDGTIREIAPFRYENIGTSNGALWGIMSVKPATNGITIIPAWRQVSSGSYVAYTGYAVDYWVTKMEMP